ncbi:MAG TPA: 4-hydroxy-tetrahydrodipicolinate reductase [Chloroflexota bacterium]
MPTRLVVAGAAGRMAREIVAAAAGDPAVEVVAGTVRPGSGRSVEGLPTFESAVEALRGGDVLVDFTTPAATIANARAAAELGKAAVIGTTGLSDEQLAELRSLGGRAPILYGRNMSVGVNAVLQILPALVRVLEGYDVEITEAHHRHKRDAPSGTALAIAEVIAETVGRRLDELAIYGREGIKPRQPGEIGIHALRGGGNAGEHTVLFADEGEQIQLVHRAYSRRTFALGALRAARWVSGRPPGFYGMPDLLGAS